MSGHYNMVQPADLGRQKRKRQSEKPSQAKHPKPSQHVDPQPAAELPQWPPSLTDFVSNTFRMAETLPGPTAKLVHEQLDFLVYSAAKDNKLWTNNWAAQRIPALDSLAPLALHQDIPGAQLNNGSASLAHEHSRTATSPYKASSKKFDSQDRKRKRAERFSAQQTVAPYVSTDEISMKEIVGTLTALEKRYLRLTSEPNPAVVRPEHVIRKCLPFVVNKYRKENMLYLYINDQLKAIRQDLTVQHIKNDLAVEVYEVHGRIAIENNDLGEFNQCQSQLKALYALKAGHTAYHDTYEFMCYRILYLLLTEHYADVNLVRLDLLTSDSAPAKVPAAFQIKRECVYKALGLLDHVVTGNYHAFFKAFRWFQQEKSMPCAFHLLEHFMAPKQRLLWLSTMCKALKKVPMLHLENVLAIASAETFVADYNLTAFVQDTDFDCSAARATVQAIVDKGNFKKVDIKGQV